MPQVVAKTILQLAYTILLNIVKLPSETQVYICLNLTINSSYNKSTINLYSLGEYVLVVGSSKFDIVLFDFCHIGLPYCSYHIYGKYYVSLFFLDIIQFFVLRKVWCVYVNLVNMYAYYGNHRVHLISKNKNTKSCLNRSANIWHLISWYVCRVQPAASDRSELSSGWWEAYPHCFPSHIERPCCSSSTSTTQSSLS